MKNPEKSDNKKTIFFLPKQVRIKTNEVKLKDKGTKKKQYLYIFTHVGIKCIT